MGVYLLKGPLDHYPIDTDVALFLPFHPSLTATMLYAGSSRRQLVRLPYFWEDGFSAIWPDWDWQTGAFDFDGLQIYNFHPIHVALNTDTMDRYQALKEHLTDARSPASRNAKQRNL